ncbi:MAG: class I SAM-dependent methyltransferase, partial [Thermoguttaceae bacterium]
TVLSNPQPVFSGPTTARQKVTANDYQLLDFGDGRRLERFGPVTLDRPCPAAERLSPTRRELWPQADARFEGCEDERGRWVDCRETPDRWTIAMGASRLELKRTEFGHVGVFPEQAGNWTWIRQNVSPPLKVLNLFAYTGGSTLAAAAAGAEVVHVDAAKNVVAWARRNAELSGLSAAPIRWIVEDAMKFVQRELRRDNRYDAVILDPPSYGHGAHGEVWRLAKHLPRLLSLCAELTAGRFAFLLLTCHTPGYDAAVLREMVREAFGDGGDLTARPLAISTTDGRPLPSGVVVRMVSDSRLRGGR